MHFKEEEPGLYVTPKVRCLVYQQRITDEIYLKLCGVEHCLPDYYFDTNGRDGFHFHVILKGKGTLSVNGKEQQLRFGQMFMTKPGENTWYKADSTDPWVYCWMTFDGKLSEKCAEDAGFVSGVNALDCHVDPQKFFAIVTKVLDQTDLKTANVYSRTGLLLEYISVAVDSYSHQEKMKGKKDVSSSVDYVQFAADFIYQNYATAKINDVARYVGLHRSYLTNLFKKRMGISPQEYLMQCKIHRACKILKETDNPIQEIARQVGYDNPLTFSKTFKNFYGISPKQYRKSCRQKAEDTEET